MRLVPGGRNIAQWAGEHRKDFRAIATAVAQVARAVAHAHERRVLHRDLKPSNILWDAEHGPQVTDFGLAKLLNAPTSTMSLGAQMLGSPSYMAPEQTGGRVAEITTVTDVYGLGAVLYELLSGRPPFQGKSAISTARMVVENPPTPLPDVPPDLQTVCLKCLQKLTGPAIALAEGNGAAITDLRFAADGSYLFGRSAAKVAIFTPPRMKQHPLEEPVPVLAAISLADGIRGLSSSADGACVLVWNAQEAVVLETASQKELLKVTARIRFSKAVIAAGGQRISCLDGSFIARTWDVASGQAFPDVESPLPERHHLTLNASGRHLTLAGWGNDISIHDTDLSLKVSPVMRHNYRITSLTPSPDGSCVFSFGWDEMIHAWDAESGRSLQSPIRLEGSRTGSSLEATAKGEQLLVHPPAGGGLPETIGVWSHTWQPVVKRHGIPGMRNFNSGSISPDGRLGAIGTDTNGPLRCDVYEIATDQVLVDAPTQGQVCATLFAPDMKRCYAATDAGWVYGWSLLNGAHSGSRTTSREISFLRPFHRMAHGSSQVTRMGMCGSTILPMGK